MAKVRQFFIGTNQKSHSVIPQLTLQRKLRNVNNRSTTATTRSSSFYIIVRSLKIKLILEIYSTEDPIETTECLIREEKEELKTLFMSHSIICYLLLYRMIFLKFIMAYQTLRHALCRSKCVLYMVNFTPVDCFRIARSGFNGVICNKQKTLYEKTTTSRSFLNTVMRIISLCFFTLSSSPP